MKNLDPTKKANSTMTNGNDSNDEDDTLEEESDEETATAMINRMSAQKKRQTKSRGNSNLNEDFVLSKTLIGCFGRKVMNYFRIAPRPTFLLGSLDKEVPVVQRKPRQASKKERHEDLEEVRTKIKELKTNSEDADSGSTVKEIERIYRILEKRVTEFGNEVLIIKFIQKDSNIKLFKRTTLLL